MSGFIAVRDGIRDFLRKYDEVITPIIKFIFAYIVFSCVNSLFGYSDFLCKGVIVFLLAVISALVTTPVMVFIAGIVITIQCFSVSVDTGVLALLIFVIMYCAYMRMFQDKGYVLALVPILYMLKLQFAAPVLVAIFAGFSGAVPAAFGVVLFYFSNYVKDAHATILAGEDTDFQAYAYIVKEMMKDKNMLLAIIAFAIVVMFTALIYQLKFDYSWYVAIGVGSVFTILVFMVCGMLVDVNISAGSLVLGSLLGAVIGMLVQMCKSMVDYSRKETVQFEDDDYYYYVKAIPKLGVAKKNKNVKTMTEDTADRVKEARTGSQAGGSNRSARQQTDGQAPRVRAQENRQGQTRPRTQTGGQANGQRQAMNPQNVGRSNGQRQTVNPQTGRPRS